MYTHKKKSLINWLIHFFTLSLSPQRKQQQQQIHKHWNALQKVWCGIVPMMTWIVLHCCLAFCLALPCLVLSCLAFDLAGSFVHLVSHSPNKKFSRIFLCYETDEYWSHFHFIGFFFQRLVNIKSNSMRRIDCSFDRHHQSGDDDHCDRHRHRRRSLFRIYQMNLLGKHFRFCAYGIHSLIPINLNRASYNTTRTQTDTYWMAQIEYSNKPTNVEKNCSLYIEIDSTL